MAYRVTHQVGNWVGMTLIWVFHPSCPATQTFLPNSCLPKQILADSGTEIAKLPYQSQPNPVTNLNLMSHPVD